MVYWKGIFNYSAINNFGVQYAKGEYLLLLNNDTEIINEDCLEELLGYCTRSDVGAVGARLYYEDDTIQHAGDDRFRRNRRALFCTAKARIYRILSPDHLRAGLQCGDGCLYDGEAGDLRESRRFE